MITHPLGFPNFYFYINFEPVFGQMKSFVDSYSKLLQSNKVLPNPTTAPIPRQPKVGRNVEMIA